MHQLRLMGAGFCGCAGVIAGIRRDHVMDRGHPMMTRGIAIQALYLGERRRPAADQGAEEGKGKDHDTHDVNIEAADVD